MDEKLGRTFAKKGPDLMFCFSFLPLSSDFFRVGDNAFLKILPRFETALFKARANLSDPRFVPQTPVEVLFASSPLLGFSMRMDLECIFARR